MKRPPRTPPRPPKARLLEAAAAEFAAHGLEQASLNRILAAAEVPKGVAYHHFEDKADLFAATVAASLEGLERELAAWLPTLDADGFWDGVTAMLARPWAPGEQGAELVRAMRAVRGGEAARRSPALTAAVARLQGLAVAVVRRGRALGVVRVDLPEDLLAAMLIGLDDAFDGWLLARVETLAASQREVALRAAGDAVRRVLQREER